MLQTNRQALSGLISERFIPGRTGVEMTIAASMMATRPHRALLAAIVSKSGDDQYLRKQRLRRDENNASITAILSQSGDDQYLRKHRLIIQLLLLDIG